jgi:acetyltransferase-like isoleucine patch superfamily enzyme
VKGFISHSVSIAAAMFGLCLRILCPFERTACRFWRLADLRSRISGNVPVTTQFDGPVRTSGKVRLRLGERCRLGRDVFFETCQDGRIEISADVRINMGCVLVAYSRITIGKDCLIGEYVSIRDANHGTEPGLPMRLQPHSIAPISIGDDVWIGRGTVILKGVTIGSGAVIGANSVVTKDVPEMMIVAGVPARVLRRRDAGKPGTAEMFTPSAATG